MAPLATTPAILALPIYRLAMRTHNAIYDANDKMLGMGFEPAVAEAIVQAVNRDSDPKVVHVTVRGGVADTRDPLPVGVTVEIHDYDNDPEDAS